MHINNLAKKGKKMAKTAQELRDRSMKALKDQKLREIVQNAPKKGDGHINLTGVYNAAFEHVYGQTKDLKKAKELAVASRWAAKLKDEYPLDFKDKMAEIIEDNIVKTLRERAESKPELKPEPKDVEIKLRGDLILRLPKCEHYLRLHEVNLFDRIRMAVDFLQAATGVTGLDEDACCDDLSLLRNYLTQILEEKFGMSVREKKEEEKRTCENCGVDPIGSKPCGHCYKKSQWRSKGE